MPGAVAGFAILWRLAGKCAIAVTAATANGTRVVDGFPAAFGDAAQWELQVDAQLLPAPRSSGTAAEKAVEDAVSAGTEGEAQIPERLAQIDAAKQIFFAEMRGAFMFMDIILDAFVRIGQDSIGFSDFLEAYFRVGGLVAIRMPFIATR